MRVFVILAIFVVVAASAEQEVDYTPWFKDEAKLKFSMACLLDKAPCGELQPLKDNFPNLVKENCARCSPEHKERFESVKKILQEKYPEYFKALIEKYKPGQ